MLFYMLAIRPFDLHVWQLYQVLQKSLLHLRRYLVKLVKINNQKFTHCLQHLLLLCQYKVVVISPLQLLWKQTPAKRTLVVSLSRYKQWGNTVTVTAVANAQPLIHNTKKPRVKPIFPIRIVVGYGMCQLTYAVVSVPLTTAFPKKVLYRVIVFHIVRFHISRYILIPCVNALKSCLNSHTVLHSLVNRLIIKHPCVVWAVLSIFHHLIIPEHVSAFKKFDNLNLLIANTRRIITAIYFIIL